MNGSQVNASTALNITGWRESIRSRRNIVRSLTIRALGEEETLDTVLAEFKQAIDWPQLVDRERNLLNVTFHDIRTIVGNWTLFRQHERDAFIAGEIVPSAMAQRARALLSKRKIASDGSPNQA